MKRCGQFRSMLFCYVLSMAVFIAPGVVQVFGEDIQGDFYVAAGGNDANPGTMDQPFAGLERARQAVREKKARSNEPQPIRVLVRAGKYFLSKPLTLTAQDSGYSFDAPVTYQAWPGEQPVISGGVKITGWKPYRDKIVKAKLPAGNWCVSKCRLLTFNGKLQIRSRWPNFDASVNPVIGNYLNVEDAATPGSDTAFKYPRGALPRQWKKPHLAETLVTVAGGWSTNVIPIASVDYEQSIITLQKRVWHSEKDNFVRYRHFPFRKRGERDAPFFVENILEELDQPGEWCLDPEEGLVYFWPPEPMTAESEVVLPRLNRLVDFNGAKHVTLSGFKFTETISGDNYHPWGLKGYGAMFPVKGWDYCGEAIHLSDAAYCRIEKCNFYGLGGNAIYLEKYNLKNEIQYNDFEYVGANGICLLGTHESHPMFNRIEDNRLERTGCILHYTAAVFAGLSDGNLIAHNDIKDVPHHGVNLSTNAYGRNYLEYNRIGNASQVLHDTGAVNMWMDPLRIDELAGRVYVKRDADRPGHMLRYNYIYNTVQGYYLDDWASNCVVYGNIFDGTWNAVTIHGGKNNLIENNIFYNCATLVYIANDLQTRPEESGREMKNFCSGNRVRNNVYQSIHAHLWWLYTTQHEWPYLRDRRIAEAERNIYYKTAGTYQVWENFEPDKTPITYEFEDWQALGYDRSSVIKVDPKLVDPENKDFNLHPDSPAWEMGFKPIDQDNIGIRPFKKNH